MIKAVWKRKQMRTNKAWNPFTSLRRKPEAV